MLEKMDDFFNRRLDGYEEHQLNVIDGAKEFYPFTAGCLPVNDGINILDLGCGTGLELRYYFKLNPKARITGIDVAEDMLRVCKERFSDKRLTVICGSYFDVPFKTAFYDAAVSIESLHHFTKAEKVRLYKKIYRALVPSGYFILTDYFARSDEEENFFRKELSRLKEEQDINDNESYHYDTPLTVRHETQALSEAGFSVIEVLGRWGATYTVKASKSSI